MEIRIYQINPERDAESLAFESLSRSMARTGRSDIDASIYDLVYSGKADAQNLEDVFSIFSFAGGVTPENYLGRSLSVSDVVEVVEDANLTPGFYYCDRIGFGKVDFDPGLVPEKGSPAFEAKTGKKKTREKTINVLYLEPGKYARPMKIGVSVEAMQKAVDGNIECYYPFTDDACIVCNDEGKVNGMRPNRAIKNKDGQMMDIIFGPFFICDGRGEELGSLSKTAMNEYEKKFRNPELLIKMPEGYQMIPYQPEKLRLKEDR